MSTKCNVCKKTVTKKSPAITCSRCDGIVHERVECSGLNNKQRTALHAAETLEWVCRDCHLSSTRRTSFLSAEEDDDEEDLEEGIRAAAPAFDLKKLLSNISKEVHKIVLRELEAVTKAAQHASDKIDEYEEIAQATKEKMKSLEKQNIGLKNQATHLETKIAALEQRLDLAEQAALDDYIELADIPFKDNEDPVQIARKVGSVLNIVDKDSMHSIRSARRLPSREGKIGVILVQLHNSATKLQWLAAGRKAELLVASVLLDQPDPTEQEEASLGKFILREALTGRTKYLLFQAKTKLKDTQKFKYVWCKYGKIFARKGDKDKVYWIRNENDIQELAA